MNETKKYKSIYFSKFIGDGLFYPFLALYLVSIDMTGSQIGLILSIRPIVSLIVNPIWGLLNKDVNRNKMIILIFLVIISSTMFVYGNFTTFQEVVLLTTVLSIFQAPVNPLIDGLTATYMSINNLKYASARLFGSIGFVIATFIGGFIIELTGYSNMFKLSSLLLFFTSFIVFTIKQIPIDDLSEDNKKGSYGELLTNKSFIVYLLAYTFLAGSIGVADNYFSIYLDYRDVSVTLFGFITSVTVITEVISLQLMNTKGSKLGDITLFKIVCLMMLGRYLGYALELPMYMIYGLSLLKGVGIGIVIAININFITRIVRLQNITLAMFVIIIVNAVFSSIFNQTAGFIFELYGIKFVYFMLFINTFIGLLIFNLMGDKGKHTFKSN